MKEPSLIRGQWPDLLRLLPRGLDLEASARARGAFERPRGVKDAETLLRLALGYGGCGMSLRECSGWAAAMGIASLSNPALLHRLAHAADWLGQDVLGNLLAAQAPMPARAGRWTGYRLRAIDATSICPPGAKGTTWRLHAGYDLASGQVDQLELTDEHGAESLTRFRFAANDIGLVDRGYARYRDLRELMDVGAHPLMRMGWNALALRKPDGRPFEMFAALARLKKREGEVRVAVQPGAKLAAAPPLILRLVMRRKTSQEAEEAQKRLRKEAGKRGKKPDPRSLEAAKYILILTSLPRRLFPTRDVLSLYRLRWQIELAFKRFKSLAGLDRLPAKNPDLARAWIYARLIAALMAERLAGNVPDSPPSGSRKAAATHLAVAMRQDLPRKRPRRHPRSAPLEHYPQNLRASAAPAV